MNNNENANRQHFMIRTLVQLLAAFIGAVVGACTGLTIWLPK